MARLFARFSLPLLFLSLAAGAQVPQSRPVLPVSVDIQVYLPDGTKPRRPVTVHIRSDDGRFEQVKYTTNDGYVFAGPLERFTPLTVTVLGEEGFYRSSSLSFSADQGQASIYLQSSQPIAPVVSVSDLYRPVPKARKRFEKALEDLEKGRLEPAEQKLQEAAELDARYAAPRIALGAVRLDQRRFEEAEEFFEKALQMSPANPHALAGLGMARGWRGDFASAVTPLEQASAVLRDPEVLFHLGVSLMETDRPQQAEQVLLSVAAKPNPFRDPSALLLGKLYVERGDTARGLAMFETIAKSPGPAADLARESIRRLRGESAPVAPPVKP
jgi:tetratricopeptide (TPR) repeat protein